MKTYFIIFSILLAIQSSNVTGQISEQNYEVAVMDKNGMDANYYFHYFVSNKAASDLRKINQINKRIGEELSKITGKNTIYELTKIIDSIDPKIEIEIKDECDLKNLKVLKIGVAEYIMEYLTNIRANVVRVKIITHADIKNHFYTTTINSQEKTKSADLSLFLKQNLNQKSLLIMRFIIVNRLALAFQ